MGSPGSVIWVTGSILFLGPSAEAEAIPLRAAESSSILPPGQKMGMRPAVPDQNLARGLMQYPTSRG